MSASASVMANRLELQTARSLCAMAVMKNTNKPYIIPKKGKASMGRRDGYQESDLNLNPYNDSFKWGTHLVDVCEVEGPIDMNAVIDVIKESTFEALPAALKAKDESTHHGFL